MTLPRVATISTRWAQREEGDVNPEETGEGLIKGRVDLTDTLRSPLGWARELRKNGKRERERDESLR